MVLLLASLCLGLPAALTATERLAPVLWVVSTSALIKHKDPKLKATAAILTRGLLSRSPQVTYNTKLVFYLIPLPLL